jgi:hypothetical protein
MSLSINRRVLHLPSGCHLGHYKVTLECLRNNNTTLPEIGIYITQIAIITLNSLIIRWKKASQIMLEKGKVRYIENSIIQLL